MHETCVLVVGARDETANQVEQAIAGVRGCHVTHAPWGHLLGRLAAGWPRLLIVCQADQNRDRVAAVVRRASAASRPLPVLVLEAGDDPVFRLQMLRAGAVDCLPAPLDESRLAFLTDLLTVRARYEPLSLEDLAAKPAAPVEMGGALFDPVTMGGLLEDFRRVAPLDSTVLLTGPTGSGKTHLARLLHDLSPRRTRPFVVVHCGAITPSLIGSEFFGHVRGAFTSADRDQRGKFAEAAAGTLLLDEIDCVPLDAQAQLLRVVEERFFEPVGSTRSERFRARLVVATNRDLEQEVAAGRFRQDLYYRLDVVRFRLLALRERAVLIHPLVLKFAAEFSAAASRPVTSITPDALEALKRHDWPGNIRELRNVVERAVALGRSESIGLADLPPSFQAKGSGANDMPNRNGNHVPSENQGQNSLKRARWGAEQRQIQEALDRNSNNRTSAALELGISRVTLYKKLQRYGLR